jgi:hypothetical protein
VQSTQGRRLFPIRPKPTNLQMRLLCRQPRDRRAPDARREIQLDSLLGKPTPRHPSAARVAAIFSPTACFGETPCTIPSPGLVRQISPPIVPIFRPDTSSVVASRAVALAKLTARVKVRPSRCVLCEAFWGCGDGTVRERGKGQSGSS